MNREKLNRHVSEKLNTLELETRINKFVSKTMEMIDNVIEVSLEKMNGELEAKISYLEEELTKIYTVVRKNEDNQEK